MRESYDPTENFKTVIVYCLNATVEYKITFDQAIEAMRLAIEMRPK